MYPLYEGTNQRLGNNNTQWIDSVAPHQYPSGGCFSINVFTLNALYELHKKPETGGLLQTVNYH